MRALWITFVVLATLGSIYPFNFSITHADAAAFSVFLQSCCQRLSGGDIVGNVVLFVPVGFTGMLGLFSERPAAQRFVLVFASGVGVALALQLLQFYLPTRNENLQDVAWNGLGLVVGAMLAPLLARISNSSGLQKGGMSLVPLSLVGAWIAYRLIPFVPSLDLQSIKDSLKPLLLDVQISLSSVLHDLAGWLVVAYLLQHTQSNRRLDGWLPALMVSVFCLEVLIVRNVVTGSSVVAALFSVVLWQAWLARKDNQEWILIAALMLTLVVSGLQPFAMSTLPDSFNWLPFRGFLRGSMYLNTQSAAEKVFLYGSLVYLLWRTPLPRLAGLILAVVVVLSIEWAQIYVVGHTPEVTDPVLIVFAALALLALERHDSQLRELAREIPQAATPIVSSLGSLDGATITMHRSWSAEVVNLRSQQQDFLASVAKEMGGSASGVARRIVASFIEEFSEDDSALPAAKPARITEPGGVDAAAADAGPGWRQQTVNLKPAQMNYLQALSVTSGHSISKLVRRIIQRFMDQLGDG